MILRRSSWHALKGATQDQDEQRTGETTVRETAPAAAPPTKAAEAKCLPRPTSLTAVVTEELGGLLLPLLPAAEVVMSGWVRVVRVDSSPSHAAMGPRVSDVSCCTELRPWLRFCRARRARRFSGSDHKQGGLPHATTTSTGRGSSITAQPARPLSWPLDRGSPTSGPSAPVSCRPPSGPCTRPTPSDRSRALGH